MDRRELDAIIGMELARADAQVSLLVRDLETGVALHAFDEGRKVTSASTIKVPIMLATLELVRRGELCLDEPVEVKDDEILDDTEVFEYGGGLYPLRELIYWMIVSSDNTATNAVIRRVGFGPVNAWIAELGLRSTVLARRMLDFEAQRAGRDNMTSAEDIGVVFDALCNGRVLTPALCDWALGVLKRQRDRGKFLRYIADDVPVAHKSGGLDPVEGHDRVSHEAGVFLPGGARYYLGVFMTGAPDDIEYSKRLIGRLSKVIYETYGR